MNPQKQEIASLIRKILGSRFIIRSRNNELFWSLVTNQKELLAFFSTFAAKLIINDDLGVAFLQADQDFEEEMRYKLGRTITLTDLETLLVIFLRRKRNDSFQEEDIDGTNPLISEGEIREFLADFNKEKEDKKFQKQFEGALTNLTKHQILLDTKDEKFFEISPVCEILLHGDRIQSMQQQANEYFFKKSNLSGSVN